MIQYGKISPFLSVFCKGRNESTYFFISPLLDRGGNKGDFLRNKPTFWTKEACFKISPHSRTKIMSGESPFLRLSSVFG